MRGLSWSYSNGDMRLLLLLPTGNNLTDRIEDILLHG